MIRIEGSAAQAEYIEAKIQKQTLYLAVPFTAVKHDGGENGNELGKGMKSRCFTRDYEIVAAREQLVKVKTQGQRRIRDIILWLTLKPINITFRYDYRVDKCEIFVSLYSWKRLLVLIPDLKSDVRIIEPNKCQIIAVGGIK